MFKLTVEVPLLLCYTSFFIIGSLVLNLNMYKVCYNILNYPEANCSRLGRYTDNSTQELEKIVQPYAGTIASVSEMAASAFSIILSLMIGSWSDKYGRKPVLLFAMICQVVGLGISVVMLLFLELNPWWLLVSSVPTILCGGVTTFFAVILSYLNDISTPETRSMRMVTFDIIQLTATLVGSLSSSYLLYATNYPSVYGICTLLIGTALVYSYFLCPESLKHKSDEKPNYKNIVSCNNLTDLFKVAGQKREHNKRSIIILIISCLGIMFFVSLGETNVKTLYLRNKFNWTLTKRTIFGAWSGLVGMICTFIGTYMLHKKFKIREILLIFVSLLSLTGSSILYAVGNNDHYIYTSVVVGVFGGIGSPLLKTMLAQLLVPEEMGKIFSLVMMLNTLSMIVSSLSYQQIYNITIDTHPEIYNYFSIGLFGIVMVMVTIVMILESRIPLKTQEHVEKCEINKAVSTEDLMKENI